MRMLASHSAWSWSTRAIFISEKEIDSEEKMDLTIISRCWGSALWLWLDDLILLAVCVGRIVATLPEHIHASSLLSPTHHLPICSSVWASWFRVMRHESGKATIWQRWARMLVNNGSLGVRGESGRECVILSLAGCHGDEHKGCWVAGRVAQRRCAASGLS